MNAKKVLEITKTHLELKTYSIAECVEFWLASRIEFIQDEDYDQVNDWFLGLGKNNI